MLSVDEALQLILSAFSCLEAEQIDIADGLGRVLTQDIHAENDLPPFANSSMDGYAVHAADIVGATSDSPVYLDVIADILAGTDPQIAVVAGQATRIMTGAMLPKGANAIVL